MIRRLGWTGRPRRCRRSARVRHISRLAPLSRSTFPPNPNTGAPWARKASSARGTRSGRATRRTARSQGRREDGRSSILARAAQARGRVRPLRRRLGPPLGRGRRRPTGLTERHAFVYDADTGALIQDILLATGPFPIGGAIGIINDVTVTKDAAYFTNTNNATNPGRTSCSRCRSASTERSARRRCPSRSSARTGSRRPRTARRSSSPILDNKYYKLDAETSGCTTLVPGSARIVLPRRRRAETG